MVWYHAKSGGPSSKIGWVTAIRKVCKFVTEEEKDKKFNKFRSFKKFPISFNNFPICFNKFPIILAGLHLATSDPPPTSSNLKFKKLL